MGLCTLVVLILFAELTLLAVFVTALEGGTGGVDDVVGRLGDGVDGLETFAFVVAVLGFAALGRLS